MYDSRFLVPADITVGKFVYEIRKHMKLSPEKAIFLFVNNVLPPTGMYCCPPSFCGFTPVRPFRLFRFLPRSF